jgi:uncharacterized protein
MNRLERVRQEVDSLLLRLTSDEDRRCGFVHLYGVSHTATELALSRGLDPELAAIAGMLHDLTNYTIGSSPDHAQRSSDLAAQLLERLDLLTKKEIQTVARAIARHSDKEKVDEPLDELLKDADVLQHWLYNPALPQSRHVARRERLRQEIAQQPEQQSTAERAEIAEVTENQG